MPSPPDEAQSDSHHCPQCGVAVADAASYCPQCGVSLATDSQPTHCRNCGEPFDPADSFCSSCGTARSQPATGDATGATDSNERDFRRQVQTYLANGWELKHDYGDRVVLVDRDIGSLGIHVVLFVLTGGLGNLLYGWYRYSSQATTVRLSVDDENPPSPHEATEVTRSDDVVAHPVTDDGASEFATIAWYGLCALAVLFGLYLAFVGAMIGSLALVGIGLFFGLMGVGLTPPVRERIDRRHSLTSFGRVRTVDNRVIGPDEQCNERCTACGGSIETGLVRRRRDETVVAGFPVRTHDLSYNHYCSECARAEFTSQERADGPLDEPVPSSDTTETMTETGRYNSSEHLHEDSRN